MCAHSFNKRYYVKRDENDAIRFVSAPGAMDLRVSCPIFVASEFVNGSPGALEKLVKLKLIQPAKYNQKTHKLKPLRGNEFSLSEATHFLVPVRDPRLPPTPWDKHHGRSLRAETSDGVFSFKGVGSSDLRYRYPDHFDSLYRYDATSTNPGFRLVGGLLKKHGEHVFAVAETFAQTYEKLKNSIKPKDVAALKLAKKHGVSEPPIMTDLVLFKLKQLPRVVTKNLTPVDARLAKITKMLSMRPNEDTRPRAAIKVAPSFGFAVPMILAYKAGNQPFRMLELNMPLGLNRILSSYGLTSKYLRNNDKPIVRLGGKKISNIEALRKSSNAFASRLALNLLILKKANAVGRSEGVVVAVAVTGQLAGIHFGETSIPGFHQCTFALERLIVPVLKLRGPLADLFEVAYRARVKRKSEPSNDIQRIVQSAVF